MKFVALDFETANSSLDSICQIGVVTFNADGTTETWHSLVDPEDYFDGWNVSIHGIEPVHVEGAPKFPHIFDRLSELLSGQVVVHHTPFDRVALTRTVEKHRLPVVQCHWLDSSKVVRRAWPEYSRSGYGLKNIAKALGITFSHHAAHEDARAAGEVILHAVRKSDVSLPDWLIRSNQPVNPLATSSSSRCAQNGNADGPLCGEVIVFTGALTLVRSEAAALAAAAGCQVADNVTAKTTLLVVGDQDVRNLAGHNQSSKHRKAIELQAKGSPLRILGQSDFEKLICLQTDSA